MSKPSPKMKVGRGIAASRKCSAALLPPSRHLGGWLEQTILAPAGPMCHRGSAFGPSGPAVRLIACAQVHSAVSGEKMTIAGETLNRVSVTKLHPVIGAEIGGVDLSRTLDNEAMRQIKDAWHQHTVLVFRDQNLSEDDQ